MMGFTSTDGYEHTGSKAERDGKFIGLMCDEDNQYDMSEDRAVSCHITVGKLLLLQIFSLNHFLLFHLTITESVGGAAQGRGFLLNEREISPSALAVSG